MNKNNVLSASGSIIKKENVRSFKIKSVSEQVILESYDPFPSLEHRTKKKNHLPQYFYIGIKPKHLEQDIHILAKNAERELQEELNAAIGEITINDGNFYVMRLKNISSKILGHVLNAYKKHNIELQSFGRNISESAVIHVKKFFYLEEIEQGFYLDLDENEKGYFEIPRKFQWNEFEEITKNVKKECKFPNFDGAVGVISKHGINQNIIRVYHPKLDKDKLLEIGKGYIKHLFV